MTNKKFKPSMIPIYVILAIAIITVAFLIVGGAYLWHYSLITKIDTLENNQAVLEKEIKKMQPEATEDAVIEEVKEMKVYENTKYGFRFEYPADWWLGNSPYSDVPNPEASSIAFDGPGMGHARFSIEILNAENGKLKECNDLESCVNNNRAAYSSDQETTGLSEGNLDGNKTKKEVISRPHSGNWKYTVTYVYKNDNLYIISLTTKIGDEKLSLPILNNILYTFKFIK